MSASASLLTGKNRRRALRALIAGPLLALGLAAGSGTAHASGPGTFTPGEIHLGNNHCSVSGWPGGTIYCGTSIGTNFPNGTQEICGTGLSGAVWTVWGTEAHPSGWKSMGSPASGGCYASQQLALTNAGDYGLILACNDNFGNFYENVRSYGQNGGWSGWFKP